MFPLLRTHMWSYREAIHRLALDDHVRTAGGRPLSSSLLHAVEYVPSLTSLCENGNVWPLADDLME